MSDPWTPSIGHPNPPAASQAKVTKVLATTSAEQVSVTQRSFSTAVLSATKGNNTANTGDVFIGFDSSTQAIKITAGSTLNVTAGVNGWPGDLSKIWLRGAVGDGVVVNFQEGLAG